MQRRIIYFFLFAFCLWLALFTRSHANLFWSFIAIYGGDTLWASGFFFIAIVIFPKISLWKLGIAVYLLGVVDELSQLWSTPLLNQIRSTYIGKLMLGQGFLWSDLICYAVGTLLAFVLAIIIDRILSKTNR